MGNGRIIYLQDDGNLSDEEFEKVFEEMFAEIGRREKIRLAIEQGEQMKEVAQDEVE